jgi:MoxR-like ATPase
VESRLTQREMVYRLVARIANKYHFAPLEEGPTGSEKFLHKNIVLMALTYLLDRNHLIIGEPGWGKTTIAKVVAAAFSGLPYNLYDAMEIRGHPQKFEEKIVGRPHYGSLARGEENVIWQGTFGLDAVIIDEINRLPPDTQDVLLQGIDTGRWNYLNHSLYEGKKPAFLTMNERDGDRENGLLPALKDRIDIVTEEKYFSTLIVFNLEEARRAIEHELCCEEYTQTVIDALARSYSDYKKVLREKRPIEGYLPHEKKLEIQEEIYARELENDALLFLQAFMAEINYSQQYGCKRAGDPKSPHTHDLNYAGVNVKHSFSPRSAMSALAYAKALAWFLGERSVTLDHMMYILPYVFAHKAHFHEDYINAHAGEVRSDCQIIHLAKELVKEVYERFTQCIQPVKNIIAKIQKGEINPNDPLLDETKHDHPLMKELIRTYKESNRCTFYEVYLENDDELCK